MNALIKKEIDGLKKFHSEEWVQYLGKRVEEVVGSEITESNVKNAINRVMWTIDERNPYLK